MPHKKKHHLSFEEIERKAMDITKEEREGPWEKCQSKLVTLTKEQKPGDRFTELK